MPIPAGSIPQQDTLVAPLIAALVVVAQQIQGVGNCYPTVPDAAPEDGSVLFAPKSVQVDDDSTNAQLVLRIEIEVLHLWRRRRLQDNLALVLAALPAWLTVLTAWGNQQLGGLAQNVNLTRMQIMPYTHAQQDYLALVNTLDLRVLQSINTAP